MIGQNSIVHPHLEDFKQVSSIWEHWFEQTVLLILKQLCIWWVRVEPFLAPLMVSPLTLHTAYKVYVIWISNDINIIAQLQYLA